MRRGKAAGIAITLFTLLTTLVEARADTREPEPKLPEVTILSTMVANLLGVGEWGFSALLEFEDETIRWTGQAFKRLGVEKLVGAHCTGVHATYQLAKTLKLPRSAISVGAIGTRIDSSLTIVPSSVE